MNKLTLGSFTRHGEPGSFAHYFEAEIEDGRKVCLESCLSGYCVGIYAKGSELTKTKRCTNRQDMLETLIMPGFSTASGDALIKAVDIANEMLKAA